jgi:hypothetical protein
MARRAPGGASAGSLYHVVFTLPVAIGAIAFQNKAVVYDLLFKTAAETLTAIAADPKHLGARVDLTAVLHTWGSALTHHPHVHVIVPGGGLSPDGSRWIACKFGFFLPVRVLSRLFRRLFLEGVAALHKTGRLAFFGDLALLADQRAFDAILTRARRTEWVVYAKRPFRRTPGRSRLPRALHPSRRDIQFPAHRPRPCGRHLQMEGLPDQRPRPAQDHDARRRRVHPPLSPARTASTVSAATAYLPERFEPATSSASDNGSPRPRLRLLRWTVTSRTLTPKDLRLGAAAPVVAVG